MPDLWTYGPVKESTSKYTDGTTVPHMEREVFLNGVAVGQVELHMHKRYGPDKRVDISFGATFVAYGPPAGGT